MKVCSFLPAATQMIYDMGLQEFLYGVTFECPQPARSEKQVLVRCVLEGKNYTSSEIDTVFSASKAQGKSLYYVEEELLQSIQPDIIFTQDTCEVCQIDTKCTLAAIAKLANPPQLIPLSPNTLLDVFDTAMTVSRAMGKEENAYWYLSQIQHRINIVVDSLRKHRSLPKRVMMMEWIEPIYNCGHWIPHQIAYAGGIDMLGNPGGDSIVTQWDRIVKYNPEVIVIAPCGFETKRALDEVNLLTEKPGWSSIAAVQNKAVYIVDFDLFTQPSASTLVSGIELLAALFHPSIFSVPENLMGKYIPLFESDLITA